MVETFANQGSVQLCKCLSRTIGRSSPKIYDYRNVARYCLYLFTLLPLAIGPTALAAQETANVRLAQAGQGKNSIKGIDGKDIDLDEARRLYEDHQKALKQLDQERQSLEAETQTLDAESTKLQARLIAAAKEVQESEERLTRTESELKKLSGLETQIRADLAKSHETIGQMLGVMQRMGREPPPIMVTKRNDALKMVRSAMILSSFFPGFKEEADNLAKQLGDLNDVISKSREERTRLANAQADFGKFKVEVEKLVAEKQKKLKTNWARLEKLKVAASRHSRAVTSLGELLKRLDAEVGSQSDLGAYEAELKRPGAVIELKPEAKQVAFVQPGRLKPAVPFEKTKGLLPFPGQGNQLRSFGAVNDTGSKSEGLYVETRKEAQIISPSDGWVIYAGQFRSYGQLLIINAGGGYHILLAGMDQIYTTVGQFVLAGEPVATMGKVPQKVGGSVESTNPVLYIEFRKDARPIDPSPWWPGGVKEG